MNVALTFCLLLPKFGWPGGRLSVPWLVDYLYPNYISLQERMWDQALKSADWWYYDVHRLYLQLLIIGIIIDITPTCQIPIYIVTSLASCWQTKTPVTVKQASATKNIVSASTNCQTSPYANKNIFILLAFCNIKSTIAISIFHIK